jgi:two-component system response regulator AtoC
MMRAGHLEGRGSPMQHTIFIVDDQPAFRNALDKQLCRMQHRVRSFSSGQELFLAVEEEVPDVVLLDLKMPGMSGLDVLKTLRLKVPETVVILLTAYGTVEDAVSAMKLGAFDFLIKTIDLESVEPVITRALEYILERRGEPCTN